MVSNYQSALKELWCGHCSVFVQKQIINEATGRSEPTEVPRFQNEPCRLSFKSITATEPNSETALVKQVVKLILSNTVEIPAGSKIIVTQNGVTETYSRSGEPARYDFHQEVILEKYKERA